jgi:hypothetical protein
MVTGAEAYILPLVPYSADGMKLYDGMEGAVLSV